MTPNSSASPVSPRGVDSLYAEAGSTSTKATPIVAVNGKDRVYATALPAPTPQVNLKFERLVIPGRA